MKILSLNQDAGIEPRRAKGAAVHLAAMREAFRELGAEVIEIDESRSHEVERLLSRLPHDTQLIYERYSGPKLAGAELARRRGLPFVLEVNSPLAEETARYRARTETPAERDLDRKLFESADLVLAVSSPVAEYARRRGAHPDRIRVHPNGVDSRVFTVRPDDSGLRSELVPAGKVALGFHGRVRPWHGFDRLLAVCVELLPESPLHLVVVGRGARRALRESELPEAAFTHVDWVPHAEIARYVATFDLLPLTYPPESACYFSPLKLAEAMACGVVPIVPNVGDLPGIVRHEREGLVYDSNDPESLRRALERLICNTPLRALFAQRARQRAEGFSWVAIAGSVLDDALGVRHA